MNRIAVRLGEDELRLTLLRGMHFWTDVLVFAEQEARWVNVRARGLQQFLGRRTDRIVLNRWVSDEAATRALFDRFYKLLRDGKAVATALRESQRFVAAHDEWKHPYYWAGWELWGAP
jgi:hypothetical protein